MLFVVKSDRQVACVTVKERRRGSTYRTGQCIKKGRKKINSEIQVERANRKEIKNRGERNSESKKHEGVVDG